MRRAATTCVLALVILVGGATVGGATVGHASPARELGRAYAAYDRGDLAGARRVLAKLSDRQIRNRDYLYWLRGMVALRSGAYGKARAAFQQLAKQRGSRLREEAAWRLADVAWARGDRAGAAKAYARLIRGDDAGDAGDVGTARFRIAETRKGAAALAAYRAFVLAHPGHPLAPRAEQILVERGAPALTAAERIERARRLTAAHLWDDAVAELSRIDPASLSADLRRQRDYWLGTTLFKRRRRYGDAGKLLLAVYPEMGGRAAEAMFHGARALSRADRDDEAIVWYHKVVARYPRTRWAEEAAYLAGWLEFNRGRYREAIAPLEDALRRYRRSRWYDDALWFVGMSHYFLGEWAKARVRLEELAKYRGRLEGGKGRYWLARIDEKLGDRAAAIAGYKETVERYPFSWYALLSRARLAGLGVKVGPFGVADPEPRGPALAAELDPALAKDDLIRRADELIAAGMMVDAGRELARGERAFLRRHDRAKAFAILLDRYRRAGNFNRPWMLAVVYGGRALSGPAEGDARRWWEHAYPRAYRTLIEKHRKRVDTPEGYLYSIMRKESGFDPHVLSYADAQGLLQMIPSTTRRVAKQLRIPYDPGRLYDPEFNVRTASWYIGRLLEKFKGQIPLGAGSFNSGPSPVMRWLDRNGHREIDEFVELVPYTQTRGYMKKVTENYARYRYLYHGEIYEQPLTIDPKYIRNQLTY